MTDDEIRTKLFEIIATQARLDPASLTMATTFADIRMESLDVVQVLFHIEDTFNIYVPTDNEHLKAATLGDLCERVKTLVADRHV